MKTQPSTPPWSQQLSHLFPDLKGRLKPDAPLAAQTWFRVGGTADLLIHPDGVDDLAYVLTNLPLDIPLTLIGASSNLIIRDGGISGVVIRLLRGFNDIVIEGEYLIAGAACLDSTVAEKAAQAELSGFEFLCSIPGSIGGAICMNAGAHGSDISHILVWVEIMTRDGNLLRLPVQDVHLRYRSSSLPAGSIVTRACFKGQKTDPAMILAYMADIRKQREMSQPVHSRTGGSTFRNPSPEESHAKAWELIDAAGCRGLKKGEAQVSELHCNFLINTGSATAADLEELGETVRKRVRDSSGIDLHWEIKRIGRPLADHP